MPFSLLILIVLALGVHLFSRAGRGVIQRYYTDGLYPYIARFLRFCFGWIPFSVGDILYGLLFLWLLSQLFRGIRALIKKKVTKEGLLKNGRKLLVIGLSVYIIFNLAWGINYNSLGIADRLQLDSLKYNTADLRQIDSLLLEKVNESRQVISVTGKKITSSSEVLNKAMDAYSTAEKQYPFLTYKTVSLKKSMWGWLGNYLGFTGYYNPFTGEAQVNTTIPLFLQPYTTCHEIAHQLGYGKEDEANFAGYLAAAGSNDITFRYSAYLDLFIYTNRNLYTQDSMAAKSSAMQLSKDVKSDLEEWRAFNKQHQNPAEPVVRWLYGKYLQGNQQPEGVFSYDKVTALLIAYYKKFGRI
ncbi:MAG: DUF3810 domain-containing protein [Ferruginibacter sp.]